MLSIIQQMESLAKYRECGETELARERELHRRKATSETKERKRKFVEDRKEYIKTVLSYLEEEGEPISTGELVRITQQDRYYTYKLMLYMHAKGLVESSGDERRRFWFITERIAA